MLLTAPITAKLSTQRAQGTFAVSVTHDGRKPREQSMCGRCAGLGRTGPVLLTSHPCLFMCVCLCVVWTVGKLRHGNGPNRGISSGWDYFTKRAVNHLQHVRFCQAMEAISPRRLVKFLHGKPVLSIKIVHDLEILNTTLVSQSEHDSPQ